jgi:hypothetical protein
MMTHLDFKNWVLHARRNARVVYYQGYLASDVGSEDKRQRTDDQQALALLGESAWNAWRRGQVLLFQKKNGKANFDYYAVRV